MVQVICDSNYKIMDISARWRGSAHDSRIWRESSIKRRLETENLRGGVILGDNGYPCSKILLTPYRISANLSPEQQRYNNAHISTRNVVEKLFGQLKNKFRCCFNGISVNLNTAKNMIIAIAVLHNIARERNLPFIDNEQPYSDISDPVIEENAENDTNNVSGNRYKEQFIDRHFR